MKPSLPVQALQLGLWSEKEHDKKKDERRKLSGGLGEGRGGGAHAHQLASLTNFFFFFCYVPFHSIIPNA